MIWLAVLLISAMVDACALSSSWTGAVREQWCQQCSCRWSLSVDQRSVARRILPLSLISISHFLSLVAVSLLRLPTQEDLLRLLHGEGSR